MGEIYVTTTADSGAGSLRQAIVDARDGDVILFDPTVFPHGTTTAILLSSFLNTTKNIEIDGGGRVVLDGQGETQCLRLYGDINASGLTIRNGATSNGGGMTCGAGAVSLSDCVVEDCNATSACGGVYLVGTVAATLNNCTIRNCTAGTNGGGVFFNNTSQATLNDCVITNCASGSNGGGVIAASSSQSVLNRCSIMSCTTTANGGAAYVYGSASAAFVGCTESNNTSNDPQRSGIVALNTTSISVGASSFETLCVGPTVAATISDGISTVGTLVLLATTSDAPTITFADGSALTVTTGAAIQSGATFTSAGRGYLAVVSGVDTSNATFNNVVLCSYGADASAFWEDLGVLRWDAADVTVPVLLEVGSESNGATQWETLIQTTGNSYTRYFPPHVDLRLFDGEKFLTTSTPDSRTYYYIGGAEGSFAAAADWSLTRGGYAIPEAPTVKDCVFIVGDVAPAEGGF